ncbi:MAG: TSUP family transporter [Pseudomonadota bacterium]
MELELWVYAALFAVAVFAGTIDAIAGGGGLLVLPALLLAGVPPLTALGTNKFQGLFGSGSASFAFWQMGHLDLQKWGGIALLCATTSAFGAFVASILPISTLNLIVPFCMILLALYFLFKPNFDAERRPILPLGVIAFLFVPLVGFYDGIFGPGAGSFYMAVFVGLGGITILTATAQTKLVNFASNVGGFLIFALIGSIAWKLGLLMAIGQLIGGRIGAGFAIRRGERLIRPLLVVMSLAMAVRLLFGG